MGITALLSTLLGFLGGAIPDILKEVRETRAASRERDFLMLQHQMQLERMKTEAGSKLRESEFGLAQEEIRAIREQVVAAIEAQAKPSGIAWIDGFNAVLRPIACVFIMVLFMVTAGAYVHGVLAQYWAGQITDVLQLANAIWGSLIGFSIEAVLGFLFGARQVRKSSALP